MIIAFALAWASPTWAACPAAPVGKTSDAVAQFVTSGTSGFGPVSALDATRTGAVVYDTSSSVVKYCNGTAWMSVGATASPVAFSVSKSSNQTVTQGADTQVTFETETFDTNGNFASNRFTPTVAGKYLITANVYCQGTGGYCQTYIRKNGAVIASNFLNATTFSMAAPATVIADMNGSTDYLEVWAINSSATSIMAASGYTYFQGVLLSPQGGVGDTIPSGAVMAFDLAACPSGWTEYTAARGRFLRGIDNGAGNDPSGTRAPGTTQADALQNITGNVKLAGSQGGLDGMSGAFAATGPPTVWPTPPNGPSAGVGVGNFDASRVARTSTETRPNNVAVLFCRKD